MSSESQTVSWLAPFILVNLIPSYLVTGSKRIIFCDGSGSLSIYLVTPWFRNVYE